MRRGFLAAMALLSLNAILFGSMGAVNNTSIFLDTGNVSDSGFRPGVDGFGFENYGEHPDTLDLTAVEMRRMFGDDVCASQVDGNCILTYPAERWMNQAISAMKLGHCEGIAVLSSLMYYNQSSPSLFQGNSTINLSLQNSQLQREIGYWWTTQVTSPGGSQKVRDSPQAVLDTLAAAFAGGEEADEWWVMGIYLPDGSGGHAITPFAVEESGNGTARILVYDNNWPKEIRYVELDLANDTWQYLASSNPDEPEGLYTGNSSTKNLEVVSLSSRLGTQQCDFCRDDNASDGNNGTTKNIEIWQSGRASLLVADGSGRRAGLLESGRIVNEIPGAEVRALKFAPDGIDHAPVILLPLALIEGSHLAVKINSTSSGIGANAAETAIIAPGFALSATVSDLKASQRQSMDLSSSGRAYNVSLKADSTLLPTITIETDLSRAVLSGLQLDPAGMINLSTNPVLGTLDMSSLGNLNPGTLQLLLTSLDPERATSSTYKSLDLMLRTDDSVSMDLAGTTAGSGMPSVSIARKNGGRQEMSMISVSRDVPASIPKVEIPAAGNISQSNATKSISSTGSSGTSVTSGISRPSGIAGSVAASIPSSGLPSTTSMTTPTFP